MSAIKDVYVHSLQSYQNQALVKSSTWTFRTIRDLKSVFHKSDVLSKSQRAMVFFRGLSAALAWLPVNIIAIPYIISLGFLHHQYQIPKPMPQLHEIIPGLFLGSDQAAKNVKILKEHKITSVLSILDFPIEIPDEIKSYKRISIKDYPHVNIAPAIEQAIEFVRQAKKDGHQVLVHCNMGKSRSASIMAALVQDELNISPKEAIKRVKQKRSVVDINYGFKKQLLKGIEITVV